MEVGVIGSGVVGSILIRHFSGSRHLHIYDPLKGHMDPVDICDVVFICVPTPTLDDYSQDISLVRGACGLTKKDAVCVIRSTVLPGTCDYLARTIGRKVVAMPEFITERTAYEDFLTQDIILGGVDEALLNVFMSLFPGKEIIRSSNNTAELIKYAHNCFGATKVSFFNWIYALCQTFGVSYDQVRNGVLMTKYINSTHTQVPGPDGALGYGGKCFPKDVQAMIGLSDKLLVGADILKAVDGFNKTLRSRYEI